MNTFERFYLRSAEKLSKYGYPEFAKQIRAKGEKELRNKAEIKSRQELITDGNKFLKDCQAVAPNDYLHIFQIEA